MAAASWQPGLYAQSSAGKPAYGRCGGKSGPLRFIVGFTKDANIVAHFKQRGSNPSLIDEGRSMVETANALDAADLVLAHTSISQHSLARLNLRGQPRGPACTICIEPGDTGDDIAYFRRMTLCISTCFTRGIGSEYTGIAFAFPLSAAV